MIKNHIIYNEYSDWTYDIKKAEDAYIWTKDGEKLIDFTSGWNVTNLGWNNQEITKVVISQLKKNSYAPMWTADPIQNVYAKLLTDSLPKTLNSIARATGGTEANEEAIKTARAYTGRKKILGFKNTYHGQSFGTMAIGYLPEYVEAISPLVGEFIQMDFPKIFGSNKSEEEILSDFEKQIVEILSTKHIAAIVCEAGIITGWGSTYIAPKGFLTVVRELTRKYGTLLVLDEIGTGFSRCGKLFGMEIEGVVPDIATFAKGLSNGVAAIGAMVTTTEIAENSLKKSNLTSTFGWTPIACAAALKTLQLHLRDRIWLKAQRDGEYLLNSLKKELKNNSKIADIRGIGMEVGLTFSVPDLMPKAVMLARSKGLHLINCDDNNIQIMPPLTIDKTVLQRGIEILVGVVNKL